VKNLTPILALFLLLISCKDEEKNACSNRAEIFLNKANSVGIPARISKKYLDSSYTYLTLSKNDTNSRNLLFRLSNKYYELNEYDKYYRVSHRLYNMSVKQKDTAHIAKALYYIGDYFENDSKIDSALHYYVKSAKYYKAANDTLNLGRTTLYKAGMLYDSGNYLESEVEAINALRFLNQTTHDRLIYECYNLIALSLEGQNNFEKSLEYFDLALEQLKKMERKSGSEYKILNSRASCYNNMGGVYEKKKDYDKAIEIYKKGLDTKNLSTNKPQLYAMLLNNLAYAKMNSNDLAGVDSLLFKALKIRDSLNITPGIVSSKVRIGEYYLHKNDTTSAIRYLHEGYLLSKKINSNNDILKSLKLLADVDPVNKIRYSQLYIKVSDSLRNAETVTRNKFARIAYETDEIEAKNDLLSKRNTNIIMVSGISALILLSVFGLYRLRTKNKELLLIHEQQAIKEEIYKLMLEQQSLTKHAREEERNRIAMDLHDGIVNKIFTTRFNLMQLETDQMDKKEKLVKELENAQEEIRRVSHELKENILFEDKSFPDLLQSYVASQQPLTEIKLDLYIDKYIDWQVLSTEDNIHIYRIIQEVLHNVIKYSKAETCHITFFKKPDGLIIRIWDNGVGFDIDKLQKGIGIKNITERVEQLKGLLNIKSQRDQGTQVEIIITTSGSN